MPEDVFDKLCKDAGVTGLPALLDAYGVTNEADLFEQPKIQSLLIASGEEPEDIVEDCFRVKGSWLPQPLSNDQIDMTLWQWEQGFPAFCNLGFTMLNFAEYGGSPEVLIQNLSALLAGREITYDCKELRGKVVIEPRPRRQFGIVLNSDNLGGRGKHWTTLFVDVQATSATIEFFNSSGNSPYPEVVKWAAKLGRALEAAGKHPEFIRVSSIRHQHGDTECGVYSLYYIYSRLNGTGYEAFKHMPIPDEKMTEFRKTHLFRGG